MTDNLKVDDTLQEGAEGNQPAVSTEKGKSIEGQQSSQELLQLKRELDLTRSELKGLQGRQDKQKDEVQRFMDEVKTRMSRDGLSIDEAEKAVRADQQVSEERQMLREIHARLTSTSPVPGKDVSVTNDVAKVLEKAKRNANETDVAAILAETSDPIEVALRVGELRTKTSPNASDASPMTGQPQKSDLDQVEIERKSSQLQKLYKEPSRYKSDIARLEKELEPYLPK